MWNIFYTHLLSALIGLYILSDAEALSWKRKPTDVAVPKGGTARLYCEVNDLKGNIVAWNRMFETVSNNEQIWGSFRDRYSIEGQYNLVITNVQEEDNHQFSCNVQDLGSARAKLTVLLPPDPPSIKRNFTGNPYKENQVVKFTCESKGGNPVPTMKWFKNGQEIINIVTKPAAVIGGVSSCETVVTLDSTDHQANYSCIVYNAANENSPLSTSTILQVQYSPFITFGPYNPYSILVGQNARLECTVDANPPVNTVSWMKNGQALPNQDKTLTFNPVVKTDRANYTCSANNGIGQSKQEVALLNAIYAPEITLPDSKTYRESNNINIECVVDANPSPYQIQWEKVSGNQSTTIPRGPNLVINNVNRRDAGNYSCKAWSQLHVSGQTSQPVVSASYIYIHIQYGPGVAVISPVSDIEVGKPLQITCLASPDGYPAATYEWKKDNTVLQQDGSVYKINSAGLQDNGLYTCTPTNIVSKGQSKQIQIDVNEIPRITSRPAEERTLSINNDNAITISCKARGRPPPAIHWYKDNFETPITTLLPEFYELRSKDVTIDTYSTEVTSTLEFKGAGRSLENGKTTALRVNDMGVYHCRVTSAKYPKPVTASQTLNLQFKPVVAKDEVRIAVNISASAQLPCTAQAFPIPQFQWYFKGNEILTSQNGYTIEKSKIEGISKYWSILTVTQVQQKDLGLFNCFVSNDLGNISQTIHLTTKTVPESPKRLRSSHQTWDSVTLVWDEGFDGGYSQQYIVKYSFDGEERMNDVSPPTALTYNVTKLRPQTAYSFVIFGKNRLGNGELSRTLIVKTPALSIPSILSADFNVEKGELVIENEVTLNYCVRVTVKYKNKGDKWEIVYQCLEFLGKTVELSEQSIAAMNISVCLKERQDVCGDPVSAQLSEEEGSTLTEQDVYIIAGVCGVIIVTLLIILVIFICRRRRNQNKYEETKPVTTEIRAQPVNGVQQSPRKTQVYDNQDGPLDLKRNQGNGFLPNGHATANGNIPHDTSYDSQIDKRVFENEMNRRNEYSTRVDFNNRQGGDLHFHGIPNSSSKDKYLDLEEKKEGSLESGYSTPDPAKPKKVIYEVVV